MDNQTDNDLKNHIRDIFENFEEDQSADKGWLLLREKYPAKNRRAVAWLWWSAAAVLLLFAGIGLFNNYSAVKPEKAGYKTIKPYRQNIAVNKKPARTKSTIVNQDSASAITGNKQAAHHLVAKTYNDDARNMLPKLPLNNKPSIGIEPQITTVKTAVQVIDSAALAASNNKASTQPPTNPGIDNIITAPNNIMRKPDATAYKTNAVPQPTAKTTVAKTVTFSVYEATYFNYAKGSGTQLNAGAGVTSDISISKNFKLSTGVALAQNTLNYANGLNQSLAQSNQSGSYIGSGFIAPQSYNARLISLDVPVNLKYEFNSANKTFISAGLSSGTFINETYTTSAQQNQSNTTNKSFDNFYFARILNVSFGMSYPLGKTNSLVIEPFVKYPLGGLGAQQLFFGSGGINLKFNLKPASK